MVLRRACRKCPRIRGPGAQNKKKRFLTYFGHNWPLNLLKSIKNCVKLSFLSAAVDPQGMARRYWSYEGFMPIFLVRLENLDVQIPRVLTIFLKICMGA